MLAQMPKTLPMMLIPLAKRSILSLGQCKIPVMMPTIFAHAVAWPAKIMVDNQNCG